MKNIRNAREGIIPFPKIDLKMKISLLFFLVTLFQLRADSGYAQKTKLSLDLEAVSVLEVIEEIEGISEFTFLYKRKELDLDRKVSIKARKQHIYNILQALFKDSPIRYKILDKQIILTKKEVSPQIKVSPNQKNIQEGQQQVEVSGTITSSHGEPLAGVNIIVKGTNRGTMSDPDGKYTIPVLNTDVLTFSFIGFKTVERSVKGLENIDVQMEDDVTALQEVEVNAGYYTIKERNRTGSIARVTAEEIEHQPVTSPLMSLQGRVAGLEISPVSGTPGMATRIRIRGENSLRIIGKNVPGVQTDGGQPLYVIDGIPINSSPLNTRQGAEVSILGGGFDPLSLINPDNIASIEVLKDGDATSIYGSRGANGVILITTKNGIGSPVARTDLDISMYKGLGKLSNQIELLNTQQYLQMRKEAMANDGREPFPLESDLTLWDQGRYTNWQRLLLGGTADITDVQGSISGGNSNTFYRLGGGFHEETLIFPGDFGYKRATGHLSVNHTSENRRFTVSASINYGVGKHNVYRGNLVSSALTLAPHAPKLYNEFGELNWAVDPNFGRATWDNPMARLKESHIADSRNLVANGNLIYRIIPGLSAKINLGYTELIGEEIIQIPLSSMRPDRRFNPETGSGTKPSANFDSNNRRSIIIEPQLNYKRGWNRHVLDILVGATYQENRDEVLRINGSEYLSDAFLGSIRGAEVINIMNDIYNEYKYNAIFGRIGYTYKDRYILNLTGRRDGSSRFGPGNRFGNFGAVGAAWIFSDEPWVKSNIPLLSFGKLRGSYGTTGNDQVGNYQYLDLYRFSSRNYQNATSLSPSALFNPEYYWEKTKKLEVAVEIGLANNRASMEVSWFRNSSSNQLIQRSLPATTGFNSVNDNFSEATIENSGWEFLLRGDIFRSKVIQWTTSINLTISRNKLLEFPGIEDTPYHEVFKVGEPLSIQRLYTWLGVNSETGEHEFLDVNEDGVINDEDRQFSNALDRDFYGGINNIFRYKGLELSFLFQFSRQNAKYLPTNMPGTAFNQPSFVLNRWQEEGDMTDVQRFSAGRLNSTYSRFGQSDANIADASFIRLKTLSLAYRFPKEFIENIGLKQLKLFVQGQNLLTLTDFKGLDPETGFGAPPLRMITSGIQLQF